MTTSYKTQVIDAYKNFESNKDITGFEDIINFINDRDPALVIDAGCGNNIFKKCIKNFKK